MYTHASTALLLQVLRAEDLRREAAACSLAREVRHARRPAAAGRAATGRALRDQLGWSLVQLGLRLVDRPTSHHLVQP
jgi:hypothetical protein